MFAPGEVVTKALLSPARAHVQEELNLPQGLDKDLLRPTNILAGLRLLRRSISSSERMDARLAPGATAWHRGAAAAKATAVLLAFRKQNAEFGVVCQPSRQPVTEPLGQ